MSRKQHEASGFPVGSTYIADFQDWALKLHMESAEHMTIVSRFDVETVPIKVACLRPGLYKLSWKEIDGTTVVHTHDYLTGNAWVDFTEPRSGIFTQAAGRLLRVPEEQP